MLSKHLQDKLRAMGRGALGDAVHTADALNNATARPQQAGARPRIRGLDELVRGQIVEGAGGTCYAIHKTLDEFWPQADDFVRRYLEVVAGGRARIAAGRLDALLYGLTQKAADGALYFDIETCGFAGTPVFLIGAMRLHDGRMCLQQFLARDYGEEAAILHQFAGLLDGVHTLVSFNGKSFDWPFVADRAVLHRLSLPARPHLDLLHQARRSWRTILPDHRLQTLEVFLCNRRRTGDIPGAEIPAAYHDFVRTGHATQIRDILQHNLLDLVTLAELVTFLLADDFPIPT